MNIEHVCHYHYSGRVWGHEAGHPLITLRSASWTITRLKGGDMDVLIARPYGSAMVAEERPAPQVVPDNGTVEAIETLVTLIVEEMHRLAAEYEEAQG